MNRVEIQKKLNQLHQQKAKLEESLAWYEKPENCRGAASISEADDLHNHIYDLAGDLEDITEQIKELELLLSSSPE